MRVADYARLWKLGRMRLQSEQTYRAFRGLPAEFSTDYLQRHGTKIGATCILDLGSDVRGYSERLAQRGGSAISADLIQPSQVRSPGNSPLLADAMAVPRRDDSVDVVFCASRIEHMRYPARLVAEIKRVLKIGGHRYWSFPRCFARVVGTCSHRFRTWVSPSRFVSCAISRVISHGWNGSTVRRTKPGPLVRHCGAGNSTG